jgi:hypothetical protein
MPQHLLGQPNIAVVGLGDRPEHAAKLGMIVALGAGLESQLGYLLALLSGGSASITMTLFQSVSSTSAKRAMLTAAAKEKLRDADHDEFKALMSEFSTRYGERSHLVHSLWGTIDDHPDLAVLCPAPAVATYQAATMGSYEPDDGLKMLTAVLSLPRQCRTYTVKDLQDVIDRLSEYIGRVGTFNMKLASRHPVLGMGARALAAANTENTTQSDP